MSLGTGFARIRYKITGFTMCLTKIKTTMYQIKLKPFSIKQSESCFHISVYHPYQVCMDYEKWMSGTRLSLIERN